jgi:hypothetical protein
MAGLSHGVPSALPLDAFTSIGMSYVLRVYFRHFGNFNKTRTLGAAIALMVWLYWTGFVNAGRSRTECGTGKDE